MKKIPILMLAVAGLASGCCEDDSDTNGASADIVGSYKMTSFSGPYPADLNGDGVASENLMVESGCFSNSTIVLKSNGTYSMRTQSMKIEDGLASCNPVPANTSGTWTRTGNTLTATQNSGTGAGTVSSWNWQPGSNTMTHNQPSGQYPLYNPDTETFAWSTGNTNSVYARQ